VPAFSHLHVGFALMLQQRLLSTCGAPALPQRIYTLPTATSHTNTTHMHSCAGLCSSNKFLTCRLLFLLLPLLSMPQAPLVYLQEARRPRGRCQRGQAVHMTQAVLCLHDSSHCLEVSLEVGQYVSSVEYHSASQGACGSLSSAPSWTSVMPQHKRPGSPPTAAPCTRRCGCGSARNTPNTLASL
jgi:hypothetical protein